jgi:hypothetical protein
MTEYVSEKFSDDPIINQLVAIDYYLHHKVKPQTLFIEEIERIQKNKIIEDKRLNHHKFRYIILPLQFNFNAFEKDNIIENKDSTIIIQYDGVNKAEVIPDVA